MLILPANLTVAAFKKAPKSVIVLKKAYERTVYSEGISGVLKSINNIAGQRMLSLPHHQKTFPGRHR